jgi:DNA-binding PadR family transcriptional regulator
MHHHEHEHIKNHLWRHVRRESSFEKGGLKYILLGMIKEKPCHGYELIHEIEERSFGVYKPSPGVIYPTLQMLEEMGYTKSSESEGKKVYTITGEGLGFLTEKKDIIDNIKGEIKKRWSRKNIRPVAMMMHAYEDIKDLLHDIQNHVGEEKAERIIDVLSNTYREIDSIIKE